MFIISRQFSFKAFASPVAKDSEAENKIYKNGYYTKILNS